MANGTIPTPTTKLRPVIGSSSPQFSSDVTEHSLVGDASTVELARERIAPEGELALWKGPQQITSDIFQLIVIKIILMLGGPFCL